MIASIPTPNAHADKLLHTIVSLISGLLLFGTVCAEVPQNAGKEEEWILPLPRWSEQELKAFRESLPTASSPGVLLPENGGATTDINELLRTPVTSAARLDHLFNQEDAELAPRLRPEDMRLFLPEAILGQPLRSQSVPAHLPTPLSSVLDVSAEFMAACGETSPQEYLIDPGLLVPEMQSHDMTRFLEFHSRDARIKLHVLITAHDRKLPADADLGKIASGGLLRTDVCLLVYPLGEPWRARLYMSKSVHEQTSAAFLSETIQACLQESLQASDVHDQLHRYAVHLSTRLFWLQRALGADAVLGTGKDQPLSEITPEVKTTVQNTSGILVWIFGGLLVLGIIGVTTRGIYRQLQLRRQRRVWLLPEPETIPRLGGAFTGGGGGMIRYA